MTNPPIFHKLLAASMVPKQAHNICFELRPMLKSLLNITRRPGVKTYIGKGL
jgi:hypothetical protein